MISLYTLVTIATLMLDPEPLQKPDDYPGVPVPQCKTAGERPFRYCKENKAPPTSPDTCYPCLHGCTNNVCNDLPAPATPGSVASIDESGSPQIALDLEELGYMCTMIDIDGFERGDCEIYKWSCAADLTSGSDKTYCSDSLGYNWVLAG